MKKDSIEKRVKKIIVGQLGAVSEGAGENIYFAGVFEAAELDEDSSFTDDLEIPEKKAEKLDTVAKIK